MRKTVLKLGGRRLGSERGFTLVELLVVVGIIVALAAVIIPAVTAFAGRGELGAQAAELDSVQTAMDAMMADNALVAVTAHEAPEDSTNDFDTFPTGNPLFGGATNYLKAGATEYFYCWDDLGNITQQDEAPAACP